MWRSSRCTAVALAALTVAFGLWPAAPGTAATTTTFAGVVSDSRQPWAAHSFTVESAGGIITADLEWSSTSADLNLFLVDPSGTHVAEALTTAVPETLSYQAATAGVWKLGVKAKVGESPYTLSVRVGEGDLQSPHGEQTDDGLVTSTEKSWELGVEAETGGSGYRLSASVTSPTGNVLHRYSPAFMLPPSTFSESQAVDIARRFDLVAAHRNTFRQHVAAMRAANPRLKIVAYENASFAQSNEGTKYPDSWYMRDADGNKVKSVAYGNFMMKPRNTGWITDRVNTCYALIVWSGYDGCYLDMLGSGALFAGYLTSVPVNPDTGKAWTHGEMVAATGALARAVRTGNPGKMVTGNNLGAGRRYFAPDGSLPLISAVPDGMTSELFVRLPEEGINSWPAESRWKQDVDMVVDAEARGGSVQAMTKVWVPGSDEEMARWHQFALSSFMLGANGRSSFVFLRNETSDPIADRALEKIDVGAPLGGYYRADGVYRRDFSTGVVLVNPGTTWATVSLGVPHIDMSGVTRKNIVMRPHTGQILKKA